MSSYIDLVKTEKTFRSNCVIKINGTYFAMRQPDSGLVIADNYKNAVVSLVLNPTSIDIKKVNTTIASNSFKIIDRNGIITALIQGDARDLMGSEVRIWLGRSKSHDNDVAMDFSEYFELPQTKLKKIDHAGNDYLFTSTEDTDRMGKAIFDARSALAVDILAATTELTMRDSIESFPSSGMIKVENEFISYASKNDSTKTLSGCIRGELGSTAADHEADTDCYETERVTGNPIDVLLKIMISDGGGGAYDTLSKGLGISASLIDVDEMEEIRDALFDGIEIELDLSNIESALKFMEQEILQFFNIRFTTSLNSKISLAVLDQAVFSAEEDVIDEDTIRDYPKWSVDESKIVNVIKINWDYDPTTNQYGKYNEETESDSITEYGRRAPLTFNFKGVKSDLDGENLVQDFARVLLTRLAYPTPEVELKTQLDRSFLNIGQKAYVESSKIPNVDGTLSFATSMEIVSRAVNFQTGDVTLRLAFTSFTNIRSGYIAPSDMILTYASQKKVRIAADRVSQYLIGWKMRLWDSWTNSYCADPVNTIVGLVNGDEALSVAEILHTEQNLPFELEQGGSLELEQSAPGTPFTEWALIFENNWTTVMDNKRYIVRFADYDDVIASQKRYGFISNNGANFDDGKPTYKVTY
jgi:hypothetical protein